MLSIRSKAEIEQEMREAAGKHRKLERRVCSPKEGLDYVDGDGDGVLHVLLARWVRAFLESRRRGADDDARDRAVDAMVRLERECVACCVAGAPLGHANRDGLCPLMYATKLNAPAVLRALLACGADAVNARNGQHFSALLVAAECDARDSFDVLAAHLSDRDALGKAARATGNGYTVLHFAAVHDDARLLARALSYDAFRCARVLDAASTAEDGDVDERSVLGQTALHKAVRYGHHKSLRVLLDAGADPNKRDGRKQTPLVCATLGSHYDCLKLLLEHGADALATDDNGKTALEHAGGKRNVKLKAHLRRVSESAALARAARVAAKEHARRNRKRRPAKAP